MFANALIHGLANVLRSVLMVDEGDDKRVLTSVFINVLMRMMMRVFTRMLIAPSTRFICRTCIALFAHVFPTLLLTHNKLMLAYDTSFIKLSELAGHAIRERCRNIYLHWQ